MLFSFHVYEASLRNGDNRNEKLSLACPQDHRTRCICRVRVARSVIAWNYNLMVVSLMEFVHSVWGGFGRSVTPDC